jgi:predicted Zn-dependent peptidase
MQIPTLAELGVVRKEKVLSNGVRLVHFEKPNAPVTLKLVFDSGSRFDPPGKEGIAHFVEHLIFAGTKKFPQKDKLAMYIESKGGLVSASTNDEVLCVNSEISEPADIDVLTSFLGELLTESLFTDSIIESERGSILQEMGDRLSTAEKKANRGFYCLMYQGTAYELDTLGTKESLMSITRQDTLDFYNKYVVSNRCSMVSAGGISIENMAASIEKNIHFVALGIAHELTEVLAPIIRTRPLQIFYDENVKLVNFWMGFRTTIISDKDSTVLRMLADTLGGGRAGLLHKKLRYEKGLIYSVDAASSPSNDSGHFMIHASTSLANLSETLLTLCSILKDVKRDGIPEELIKAKKETATKRLRVMYETAESWVDGHFYQERILSQKGKTVVDRVRSHSEVTNEDIIRVANKYFKDDAWYMTVAGNIKEVDLPKITL